MFSFLNKIDIPKKMLSCLVFLVIVLVILYFTGFLNKSMLPLPFENYENLNGLSEFKDTLNINT